MCMWSARALISKYRAINGSSIEIDLIHICLCESRLKYNIEKNNENKRSVELTGAFVSIWKESKVRATMARVGIGLSLFCTS